jgi:hypothetical protein
MTVGYFVMPHTTKEVMAASCLMMAVLAGVCYLLADRLYRADVARVAGQEQLAATPPLS